AMRKQAMAESAGGSTAWATGAVGAGDVLPSYELEATLGNIEEHTDREWSDSS
ncbi:MAG: hypothetical protein Q9211_003197, partial [Gyalolechia sp. 1 TL-2023]